MSWLVRMLSQAVSWVIIILLVIFAYLNWSTTVSVDFGSRLLPEISISLLVLAGYFLGLISGLTASLKVRTDLTQRLKQWELRREKAENSADSAQSQVKALEDKIQPWKRPFKKRSSHPLVSLLLSNLMTIRKLPPILQILGSPNSGKTTLCRLFLDLLPEQENPRRGNRP